MGTSIMSAVLQRKGDYDLSLLRPLGGQQEMVNLLCTLITFFPSSIRHHYDNVEAAIASKIISGKCSISVSKVTVPIRPQLALVGQVISVDGALCQTLMPILLVSQQLFLCSELPLLQLCSLDLLTSIIKGVGSQLLPHAADVVRLLTECFRRCALPDLRIKLYSIAQRLLISMGIGMALYLASEVIINAFVDLNFTNHNSVIRSSQLLNSKSRRVVELPSNQRKRQRGPEPEPQNAVDAEAEDVNINSTIPVSVQISALKALEALLTVCGTLRSE
ncbi:uncharacterized protein LOC18422308 isoform X1 [Amborella trichopoda]|uniref:uncharacterized protein LOC18422308 isoform X1 n=2 Tax=Amborella trichopoda TaxID=13333 RepID=UPI0009BE477F|nr:uncharacterized protein LOC18422308 isoform X1 [Amborella trichopoda]XP_020519302.1 uncharacterized protein LOC18422308 isoform X1 [Amborella trichopoda]XP_020519305.1 uncharacterized protein LOC18422308 isoform X1 [Amborella trichopoda]XP_020519309.1 uncharacterized protein LOC18422308 isoform X1 [Amborella trichopoda]XP_020519312.1 uncharacterized protein LOC18422308 isoform X1 [Amborella trichopoda]XP_020519317.1 uncharacterized protein LOC18422308 isoform X1 [Amborella trichopoda]XP_02|eukprot:XP_020519298.1 uncharacterized protein LOC18422308 isoform X1 [Amborella trichopoda]